MLAAGPAGAQEPAAVRHSIALDAGRIQPFERHYDVVVYRADTAGIIGERHVRLEAARYGGNPAWLLIERRSGSVPAVESLYVTADARPIHWSSWLGAARLGAVFVRDTLLGATTVGNAKQNLAVAAPPDLLVSAPMVELVLGLLPLRHDWRDSATVLVAGSATHEVVPAEIVALGEESLIMDSAVVRPSRVVALRTERRSALYWLDPESSVVLRMQQTVPAHVGQLLEYRLRPSAAAEPARVP